MTVAEPCLRLKLPKRKDAQSLGLTPRKTLGGLLHQAFQLQLEQLLKHLPDGQPAMLAKPVNRYRLVIEKAPELGLGLRF